MYEVWIVGAMPKGIAQIPSPLMERGDSFRISGVPLIKPPETERWQRHPGQLNVIWDNAPVTLRQAQEG